MVFYRNALKVILTMMRMSWGQPVNLITPSMSVSMKSGMSAINWSLAADHIVDGDISSSFIESASSAAPGNWVQIDMLTQLNIQTIYMAQYTAAGNTVIEVYIGNTPGTGDFTNDNTLCHTGSESGVTSCVGSGRYLIFTEPSGAQGLQFGEIYAWDEPEIAEPLFNASEHGMYISSGSIEKIFGLIDSTIDSCVTFEETSGDQQLCFDLSQVSQVTGLMVQCGKGFCNIGSTNVEVRDSTGAWNSCSSMNLSGQINYSTCTDIGGDRVCLNFYYNRGSGTQGLNSICKVAVFGLGCDSMTPSIDSVTFSSPNETLNLLSDPDLDIALPVLSISPSGCFAPTWSVYRLADNVDMEALLPVNYVIDSTNLNISHVLGDFSDRLSFFSNGAAVSYYFEGTLSDTASTSTGQHSFTVDFIDACRTATIATDPLNVNASVVWGGGSATSSRFLPPFEDSVDALGTYPTGACGEKIITILTPASYPFVSIVPDAGDPITQDFDLLYTESAATEADIAMHTVHYEVEFKEYLSAAGQSSLIDSFQFEIQCPTTVSSSSLDIPIQSSSNYDVASGQTLSLTLPAVTVNPASCFSIASFDVIDASSLTLPDYLSVSSSTVDIFTDERLLIGSHTLQVTAIVDNAQQLHSHTFEVEFEDTCRLSSLIEQVPLETLQIRALESEILVKSYASYTDSISDGYGLINTCGPLAYSLLEPHPTFASVKHTAGDSTFQIEIDASAYAQDGTYTLVLVTQLVDYPTTVRQALSEFQVKILPVLDPWQPPPPPIEKEEQEKPVIEEETEPEPIIQEMIVEQPRYQPNQEDQRLANLIRDSVNGDQNSYPYPIPYISETSLTGKVIILFTRALQEISPKIDLKQLEYEQEPDVWLPAFTVEIQPALTQEPENVAMDWTIENYSASKIELQLVYEKPLYISFEDDPDILVINFADEELFITENGIKIQPQHRVLTRNLMRQLPTGAVSLQEALSSAAESSQAAATAIFCANLLLGIGLLEIFNRIQALQIIILLPLMNAKMPANTGMFFNQLTAIAAFDILETGELLNENLDLLPRDPVNEKFETIGLETLYFINNMGTFIFMLALKILLIILWIVLYPLQSCSKWIRKQRNKLGISMFWNSWITVINQSFIIVGLCAMISFRYSFEFESWGQTLQTTTCMTIMFIYVALPLYIYFKSMQSFDSLSNREARESYGAFYEGNNIKLGKKVLLHPLSFILRRLILVYLVVIGTQELIYQMMILMSLTMLSAVMIYQTEAFISPSERRLSTFSEFVILQICYCFLCFDLMGAEENFEVGIIPIAYMGAYLLICLIIMISGAFITIRRKIKLCCAKRRHKRQRRFLREFLKYTHEARLKKWRQLRDERDKSKNDDQDSEFENNSVSDDSHQYQASLQSIQEDSGEESSRSLAPPVEAPPQRTSLKDDKERAAPMRRVTLFENEAVKILQQEDQEESDERSANNEETKQSLAPPEVAIHSPEVAVPDREDVQQEDQDHTNMRTRPQLLSQPLQVLGEAQKNEQQRPRLLLQPLQIQNNELVEKVKRQQFIEEVDRKIGLTAYRQSLQQDGQQRFVSVRRAQQEQDISIIDKLLELADGTQQSASAPETLDNDAGRRQGPFVILDTDSASERLPKPKEVDLQFAQPSPHIFQNATNANLGAMLGGADNILGPEIQSLEALSSSQMAVSSQNAAPDFNFLQKNSFLQKNRIASIAPTVHSQQIQSAEQLNFSGESQGTNAWLNMVRPPRRQRIKMRSDINEM